ncbi:LON peptidase substrate-binding domain-containing protein [Shewanella sp. cp20]|uniref:LON peptidase substrate-binding domain-containing protein n=1 Tax=Shewanella sp. cp20 TaxID=1521167 RepID=UPI00069AF8DA|nr:LON peptidase substrate-binding domain-containing protein [Shewanella sp. cp20]
MKITHETSPATGAQQADLTQSRQQQPTKIAEQTLSVFPLPLFVLPGGVQRLRIFEQRYLAMVTESMADESSGSGFVIARYDKAFDFNVPDWGTKVQIVDFHHGEDGLLVIDVRASHLVSLDRFEMRGDGLLMARCRYRDHWPAQPPSARRGELGQALSELFVQHPPLAQLYPQPEFNRLDWVCARFLEILPLSLNEKEKFILPNSFPQAKSFLDTFILGQDKIN